jgi:hypothetical protein
MNRKQIICLIVLTTVLSNCGPAIKVLRLSEIPLQPKHKDAPILVFMTKAPTCPYKEIAIITTSEGAFAGGMETFVDAMKLKAQELGADALLLGEMGSETQGYIAVAPGVLAAATGSTLKAVAILFLDQDCKK